MPSLLIVVPTRNRGELACAAIRSVLTAGGPRVSVLVSDNSLEPGEVERLAEFCRRSDDPRVSYIRPPRGMSMVDHWNWAMENALERASVTHVGYLSDRMVFRPDALPALQEVAGRHPDDVITFNFDSIDDRTDQVRVVQNQWSGRVIPIPSRRLLDLAAQGDVLHRPTPRMLNCVVPITLLHEVRARFGHVFGSLAPDYCFAYRCLAVRERVLFYDRPCIIEYGLGKSHGSNVMRGRRTPERADFVSLAGPKGLNYAAPIPGLDTALNAVFHEYYFVRSEVGGGVLKPVALEPYLETLAAEVAAFEDPALRAEAQRVLREHGWRQTIGGTAPAGGFRGAFRRVVRSPRQALRSSGRFWRSRILGHRSTKGLWLSLARRGMAPPDEQSFVFASVQEALDFAYCFPRRAVDDVSHLGVLSTQSLPENDATSEGRSSSTRAGR